MARRSGLCPPATGGVHMTVPLRWRVLMAARCANLKNEGALRNHYI